MAAAGLKRNFDDGLAQILEVVKRVEPQYPRLSNDMRHLTQELYSIFAQTCHTLASRDRRLQAKEAELTELRAELAEYEAGKAARESDLETQLEHLQTVEMKLDETVTETTLRDLTSELRNIHTQLDDNTQWQAKLHRVFETNAELREQVEDLNVSREDLSNSVELLKTELTGRIQQVQMLSKGLGKDDSPMYQRLLNEMQQNTMKALAYAQGRRRYLSAGTRSMEEQPRSQPPPAAATQARRYRRTVTLRRPQPKAGLGFMIQGGATAEGREVPVHIVKVYAGEPAHLSGQVFEGDLVVALNDLPLKGRLHSDIVSMFQNASTPIATNDQGIQDLLHQAEEQVRQREYEAAQHTYTQALNSDPNNPRLHRGEARLMLTIRQPEAALVAVKRAIELEPHTPSGHYIQAMAYRTLHQWPAALAAAKKAVLYGPEVEEHDHLVQELQAKVAQAPASTPQPNGESHGLPINPQEAGNDDDDDESDDEPHLYSPRA